MILSFPYTFTACFMFILYKVDYLDKGSFYGRFFFVWFFHFISEINLATAIPESSSESLTHSISEECNLERLGVGLL